MPYLTLSPKEKKRLRAELTNFFSTSNTLGLLAGDAGIPRQRINFGQAPEFIAQELLEEALRLGKLEALLAEARERYPAHSWPVYHDWAEVGSLALEEAEAVTLILEVTGSLKEAPGAPEDGGKKPLAIHARLVHKPSPTSPTPSEWPRVWSRTAEWGELINRHFPEKRPLRVCGMAPLATFLQLGFAFREPGRHEDAYVIQNDKKTGEWRAWNASPPESPSPPVFSVAHNALDTSAAPGGDVGVVLIQERPYPLRPDVLRDASRLAIPENAPTLHLYRKDGSDDASDAYLTPARAAQAAQEIRKAIRKFRLEHGSIPLHLFIAAPGALAFMIGQKLNALGSFLIYNRQKDGENAGRYHLAGTLYS